MLVRQYQLINHQRLAFFGKRWEQLPICPHFWVPPPTRPQLMASFVVRRQDPEDKILVEKATASA